jgi:hypothetical protein
MEVSGQLHVPIALFPGTIHRYPLDRRQVGSRFGLGALTNMYAKFVEVHYAYFTGIPKTGDVFSF